MYIYLFNAACMMDNNLKGGLYKQIGCLPWILRKSVKNLIFCHTTGKKKV